MSYPKLTALRSIELLHTTETGSDSWKVDALRRAVRDHLRALVSQKKRRRRRKG